MNILIIENKPKETLRTYRKCINKYQRFLAEKRTTVSTDSCLQFLVNMSQVEKLKPATIKLYMIILKRYFKFAAIPFPVMKMPNVPLGPPIFIEKVDFQKLYDATAGNPLLRSQISMCYSAGLRITELCTRKVIDVDLEKKRVFVGGKTGPETDAWLPLTNTAKRDAQDYLADRIRRGLAPLQPDDYFYHREGNTKESYSTSTIESHIYGLCDQVGMKRKSWHKVRHSRATHLREDNVRMEDIKDLLRHKSIKTTERYARTDTEKLRTKIQGKGELDEGPDEKPDDTDAPVS